MVKIDDAIEGALLLFSTSNSPSTERIYRVHLYQFKEYLIDNKIIDIQQLDEGIFIDFYKWIQKEYIPQRLNNDKSPYSPASIANVWCALRMFDKFLKEEFKTKSYTSKLKKPSWKPPEIKPFTKEEIEKLLKACMLSKPANTANRKTFQMKKVAGRRNYFLLLVLLDTGLRAGEISRLNINDYNQTTGEIRVRPFGTGKKTKPRTVYLGKTAKRAAWRYLAERKIEDTLHPDDPLFVTSDGRKRMTRNAIRLICNRIGEQAGVEKVHPHRFRHTFAIEFLRNGGNMYILSEKLLGHSDLTITKRYLHLVDDDAFNEHHKASPADRWKL